VTNEDLTELAQALDDLAAVLAGGGETSWSRWVGADADRLRRGDEDAVVHFLGAFGGMGSLNDVNLPDTSLAAARARAFAMAASLRPGR
jgi:hypothetical protein